MSRDWSESQVASNPIKPCAVCGSPPAASVQVGGSTAIFWFECKTCRRKTGIRASFDEARQEWNGMQ
jgi:hypothetical protein